MSINVLGLPTNVETNAFPLASSLPLNPATHNVTATNNSPNDIIVNNSGSLSLTGVGASAQGSLNVGGTVGSLSLTAFSAIIEGTSVASNNDVTASLSPLAISAANAVVDALALSIDSIPNITLNVGLTHDMSQYINNPNGVPITTTVLGINPSFATYSDTTKLLTGVATGAMTSLQLEVTTS